ncbi:hypothetical protein J7T55_002195 [Diaporthe amygdali]|uniref:uncharacterized protein n=1 Tax=Phomopsis amygdali TaxID=1214568 RepID=UPI0022FEE08F|nr:uncharacterized protein J7T55_002195 [Diaporthe amygdali]KAJ0103776.1 hypothetical protein J7T55_002195 [Diaporthe amygdali]
MPSPSLSPTPISTSHHRRSCSPPACHIDGDPDIVLSGAPALVSWPGSDGTTQYIAKKLNGVDQVPVPCCLKCDVRCSSASRTALFKLNIRVLLRAQHHSSKNTANLFIVIKTEQVNALNIHTNNEHVPGTVSKLLSRDAVCLKFALSSPPTIIAPRHPDPLVPKNEQAARVLSSLQILAQQTDVAVFLSHRALSRSALESLCAATSNPALAHLDQYFSISSLYGGKGGRTLYPFVTIPSEPEHEVDAGPASPVVESPPSYDELGPGPPSLVKEANSGSAHFSSSQKRPRPRSRNSSIGVQAKRRTQHPAATGDSGENCRNISMGFDSKEVDHSKVSKIAGEVQHQLEDMERRLADRLESFLTDLFERHKDNVVNLVEQRLEKHRESLEKRLEEHDEEIQRNLAQTRDEIEVDVEEQLLDRKCELDQMVKDEREGLEEDLRERLEGGLADVEHAIIQHLSTARAVLHFE